MSLIITLRCQYLEANSGNDLLVTCLWQPTRDVLNPLFSRDLLILIPEVLCVLVTVKPLSKADMT